MSMTPEQLQAYTWQREIDERNRPLSDEELDSLFPEGYKVLQPPAGYVALSTKLRLLKKIETLLTLGYQKSCTQWVPGSKC